MKSLITCLALTLAVASAVVATEPTVEYLEDGQVLHTTLERSPARPPTPEEAAQMAADGLRLIELRRAKLEDGNHHPWIDPVPVDPSVNPAAVVPRNPETVVGAAGRSVEDPLTLFVNSTPSSVAPIGYSATVSEPSAVAIGDRVQYVANWFTANSANLGTSFSYYSIYAGPFTAPSGEGMCCDQVTAVDPATSTVFWLQQYIPNNFNTPSTPTGTQRINVDQGGDGSWDCAYDINTVDSGFVTNTWFDFPDLVVSDNYLWHTSNVFTHAGSYNGNYTARYPLAELAQCAGTLSIDAYTATTYSSKRFVRGAGTTMYFADHVNTATMRIFSWPDADSAPAAVSRAVTGWLDSTRVCGSPDGREWCGGMDSRIQSGFLSGSTIGFMWTASQGGGFAKPYTRISTFDIANDLAHLEDVDIWSADVGYVHASAAVNSAGQIGGTILWGGSATYQSCSAWLADDPTSASFAPLDSQLSITGTSGPSSNRSGDYTWTNLYSPNTYQFTGACFALSSTSRATAKFVHFGAASSAGGPIFLDGFESAGTGAWSYAAP